MTLAFLGPLPCISCRESVMWIRFEGRWRLVSAKNRNEHHVCAARKAA